MLPLFAHACIDSEWRIGRIPNIPLRREDFQLQFMRALGQVQRPFKPGVAALLSFQQNGNNRFWNTVNSLHRLSIHLNRHRAGAIPTVWIDSPTLQPCVWRSFFKAHLLHGAGVAFVDGINAPSVDAAAGGDVREFRYRDGASGNVTPSSSANRTVNSGS